MTDIRTRLADALLKHPYVMGQQQCFCGTQCWSDTHREHVADVLLSLPGIAIVDSEYIDMPTKEAMRSLVIDWHDQNEAGCCDSDEPPYCAESKAYAHGYLAALAAANETEGKQ